MNRNHFFLIIIFAIGLFNCRKDAKNNNVNPGDFLSSGKYSQLRIEVQSVSGFEPDAATLSNIKTFLEARLNKPGGIEFVYTSISSPGKSVYSISDVRDI